MRKPIAWLFVLAFTQFSAQPNAQSHDDAVRQLAGMWRLVSNPQKLADGTTRQGANGVTVMGYAFFDTTGRHMCYVTMSPNRPTWKSDNAPTPDEALTTLRGINSYCATLEIHPNEGYMDRRYDINQSPNAVGRPTRRWFSFQGPDHLTLRVDDAELNRPVVETLFIWERVKD